MANISSSSSLKKPTLALFLSTVSVTLLILLFEFFTFGFEKIEFGTVSMVRLDCVTPDEKIDWVSSGVIGMGFVFWFSKMDAVDPVAFLGSFWLRIAKNLPSGKRRYSPLGVCSKITFSPGGMTVGRLFVRVVEAGIVIALDSKMAYDETRWLSWKAWWQAQCWSNQMVRSKH